MYKLQFQTTFFVHILCASTFRPSSSCFVIGSPCLHT